MTGSNNPARDATQIAAFLREHVAGEVYDDITHCGLYATDASHYQMMPCCVVLPRDEADVAAVVEAAGRFGAAIIGRGGGTSLAGQTFGHGIVVDFSKYMNAIVEVDPAKRTARVQPGAVRDHLNACLGEHGLQFGPDPATTSRATIGGMIANNSSGTRSIVQGMTIDHVIALKVMLSDGTICTLEPCDTKTWSDKASGPGREAELYRGVGQIIKENWGEIDARFPKLKRRVSGYALDAFVRAGGSGAGEPAAYPPEAATWNLSHLLCGSEGTLGIILEATVNLVHLAGATALCVVHFDDLIASLRPVPRMLDFEPSALELLDESIITEARRNASTRQYADFFEGEPRAVQVVEFSADTAAEAAQRAERFAAAMREEGIGYAQVVRTEPRQIANVWELRRLGVGLQSNVKGRSKPLDFVDDACVPVEKLADYIERLQKVCTEQGVPMPVCCHASVGVLHPKPMLDLHKEEDRRKMQTIAEAAFEMVLEYGGSWAGEHGDGLVRGQFIQRFFGDQIYEAFKQVKALFDPAGVMNPGKILDTPGMTEYLRHGVQGYEQRIAEVKPNFHYREQGGFALAVEQCNGIGACRKIDIGTMCPSYMATRDEETSTRGRANALRLAMSGQLGQAGLSDDGVADVLSLCLSCKACKSECPNAVDMAKLKSEVTQMRYDERGVPLGARMIGDSPRMAKLLAGPVAPLVNAVQGSSLVRKVVGRVAGVDARRVLPRYASRPLSSLLRHRGGAGNGGAAAAAGGRPKVVLFDDTYANYYEPQIGIAAVELLEACGFEVVLARAGCCQRPRLSKGLVHAAKRDGRRTLGNLLPYAEQGLPILFLEPSCASAIGDDLPDLVDDDKLGKVLRKQVKMLDTFLAEQLAAGTLNGTLRATTDEVLVHGHCHQKALFGTGGMMNVFASIEDLKVSEVDAGCCGMAGAFGYEHYDLSLKIAEQRLLPAVRAAQKRGAAICANGFSCRHQVHDTCGVMPLHFVQLVQAR